jgi:Uma2 family endonuclease
VHHPSPALLESLRPLRRAEYDRLVELGAFADEHIELLAGMLVAMPPPHGAEHASLVSQLLATFVRAVGDRAIVRPQLPIALFDDSEPEPDIALVSPGDYRHEHPTRALLVVEIADSSLRRDREVKAALYAAANIPEYWIVNLIDRVVEVHRAPSGDRYTQVSRVASGASLQPGAFTDVVIEVATLFAS